MEPATLVDVGAGTHLLAGPVACTVDTASADDAVDHASVATSSDPIVVHLVGTCMTHLMSSWTGPDTHMGHYIGWLVVGDSVVVVPVDSALDYQWAPLACVL